jgi:hypothetical protein
MASGREVLYEVAASDDSYYVAKKGDRAELEFAVPAEPHEGSRTIFLHSRGYYRPEVPSSGPADTRTLHSIFRERDGLARFAALRWAQVKPAAATHH